MELKEQQMMTSYTSTPKLILNGIESLNGTIADVQQTNYR